jgi:hypothetical protein
MRAVGLKGLGKSPLPQLTADTANLLMSLQAKKRFIKCLNLTHISILGDAVANMGERLPPYFADNQSEWRSITALN